MTQLLAGYFFAFATAMIVILGDIVIKQAADNGFAVTHYLVLAGCTLYAVSALFWFYSVQHVSLAQAGVAFSMLSLFALAVLGALMFGEKLYFREYLGLACAFLAMVLMSRVA